EEHCYCDPTFHTTGCNIFGCHAAQVTFIVMFAVPLIVCIYRVRGLISIRGDHRWSLVTHIIIIVTCIIRIGRATCGIVEVKSYLAMQILLVIPIVFLICCFLNTFYVWIHIIYQINFGKRVERVFPILGKVMIGLQVLLFVLMIIGSCLYIRMYIINSIICVYIACGAIGFAIFGRMIWNKYKVLADKSCGVFNEVTHLKVKRVMRMSIAAIIISLLSIGATLWLLLDPRPMWSANTVIGFNMLIRSLEIGWIITMLLILSPSLQTHGNSSTSRPERKVSMNGSANFDDEDEEVVDESPKDKDVKGNEDEESATTTTTTSTTISSTISTTTTLSSSIESQDNYTRGARTSSTTSLSLTGSTGLTETTMAAPTEGTSTIDPIPGTDTDTTQDTEKDSDNPSSSRFIGEPD
ncbi:hypothetical protein SAMD00019534_019470, partial [Acytostelium subglobosum LB1]|uniref:hypothetical protein n=1 Tax=Acytostelium subglobosum LB1 TaxID=1410327 RepID=UPI0006447BB0